MTLLTVLLCSAFSHAGMEYFRYKTAKGTLVIDSRLPPEYVKYGYEVINASGDVLRTVLPQATAEQIAAKREALTQQQLKVEQRKKDEMLMRRYSSVADIEASQNRVIDEINIRLSILRGNLRSLKGQIERQQEVAANSERAGRDVPQALIENIGTMEVEVDDTRKKIRARKKEITAVKRNYASDMERFEHLQELRYGHRRSSQASSGS
ncbi:MAG: hypothetical protein AB8B48_06770 [Pseudomonadales bacterium]